MAYYFPFVLLIFILKSISSSGPQYSGGFGGIQWRSAVEDVPKLGMSGGFFGEFGVPAVLMSNGGGSGCHLTERTSVGGVGGENDNRKCGNPPIFCDKTSCCLPSGQCGCRGFGGGGECEDVKSYKVKLASCSFDGLRVRVDFQVGIKRGTCDEMETETETLMELNEEGEMGIRLRTTNCWNATSALDVSGQLASFVGNDYVVLVGVSVRIEDPDSYLVEKFLMRIFENLDLVSVMDEFGEDEWVGGDNRDESSKQEVDFSNWKDIITTKGQRDTSNRNSSRWGCQPEPNLDAVAMDSGFSPAALLAIPSEVGQCTQNGICGSPPHPCPNSSCCYPKLNSDSNTVWYGGNCGCHDNRTGTCERVTSFDASWSAKAEDGMVVGAKVTNYFPLSLGECGVDGASVSLEPKNQSEWTLTISISQCIQIQGHNQYGSSLGNSTSTPNGIPAYGGENGMEKSVRFIGSLEISEGSIYKRMLKIAKEFVVKRMNKKRETRDLNLTGESGP